MIMLNEQDLGRLLEGQSVFTSPSRRGATEGEIVRFVPIRSPKTGRVVRINVYSQNPTGKGKGRK
jgi:hypothetical protein